MGGRRGRKRRHVLLHAGLIALGYPNAMLQFSTRQMAEADIAGVVGLQRACFPAPFPEELLWNPTHLRRHLDIFPQGQFVAEASGEIIGSASSLIIDEDCWTEHRNWDDTTGGHFLSNHDPTGTTLYGADVSVSPDWRGKGVGRKLYEARFDLVRRQGLTRYGTACRIPDYATWRIKAGGPQEEYVDLIIKGEASDRTLTPLLRYGLKVVGIVHGHMQDEESGDAAAILEWTP